MARESIGETEGKTMNLWEKALKMALIPVGVVLRVVVFFFPALEVWILEDDGNIDYFVADVDQEETFFDGTSCQHRECWAGRRH